MVKSFGVLGDRGAVAELNVCVREDAARREQMIGRLAGWIVARGLESPAILFFELSKPLALLGSQALLVLQPLLGGALHEWANLLEDPATIDRILDQLESRDAKL
jgi:hypothetical protein